jgi:16S rRNA (adenine1518-N6/adenine1519-N6)-dimethyltransferase
MLTPTSARELMARHGLAMRRRDGQNLLIDPNTVRRIVAAARLQPDDVVLEVGPGLGSLTLALAPQVRKVVAVELDAGFVAALADVLSGQTNVEVIHADALAVDLVALVDGGPARLVANLPYNVATPVVIETLAEPAFRDAFVMVQREVGERWAARPGDRAYAGVSAKLGLLADVTVELTIPRSVFLPVPNVDSVMVRLLRRDDAPDADGFARAAAVIDVAFAQRRKTLRNTLRTLAPAATLTAAAEQVGIDLSRRAEELTPHEFRRLAEILRPAPGAPTPSPSASFGLQQEP